MGDIKRKDINKEILNKSYLTGDIKLEILSESYKAGDIK